MPAPTQTGMNQSSTSSVALILERMIDVVLYMLSNVIA